MQNNLMQALQGSNYFLYRPPVCYTYTGSVMRHILEKLGFEIVETHRDIRTMNIEKVVTLLGWRWALQVTRALRIGRLSFRIYAYPSKIIVARRNVCTYVKRISRLYSIMSLGCTRVSWSTWQLISHNRDIERA